MRAQVDQIINDTLKHLYHDVDRAFQEILVTLQMKSLFEEFYDTEMMINDVMNAYNRAIDLARWYRTLEDQTLPLYTVTKDNKRMFLDDTTVALFVFFSQSTRQYVNYMDIGIKESLRVNLLKQQSISEMMDILSKMQEMAKNKVELTIVTEYHRISIKGQLDEFERNGITKVRFVAVLDGRTCSVCSGQDREIIPTKYAFGLIPLNPYCRCYFEAVL